MMIKIDVLIIGAGAAGLMCAIEAGKRGRQVLVIDHANKPGKKIIMSGGGRCNFTNENITPQNYISHNPHFFKSALSRYTSADFLALVRKYNIPYHEKKHGQLFCDNKSKDILNMLLEECKKAKVTIHLNEAIEKITKNPEGYFELKSEKALYRCPSLVIATGGLSVPTLGATPFGYKVAAQFNIKVWPVRAGLVPLTLHTPEKERLAVLSGISNESQVICGQQAFRENILFTHRGLSGPAILQISNYWVAGENIIIDLLPTINLAEAIKLSQKETPKLFLKDFLARYLSKRVIPILVDPILINKPLPTLSHKEIDTLSTALHTWHVMPNGTEGYRTAEVTLGGVDCNAVSSKTMEANNVKGLFFIGEVMDVSGWLGGYNFQWAWSSGWAAGQVV